VKAIQGSDHVVRQGHAAKKIEPDWVEACQPCADIKPITDVDSGASPASITDASATRNSAPDASRDSRRGWRG
jgi:hypothetical protein